MLVLTTFDLDAYVYEALRAGASGFLLKDVPPHDLVTAIRAVAGGHAVVAPAVTRRLLDTLVGGAVIHAQNAPPDRRAALAKDTAAHARRLVDFLLHAVTAPATASA